VRTRAPSPCGIRCFAIALLALLTGCNNAEFSARKESAQRWDAARSQVKARLASDQLSAGHIDDAAEALSQARQLNPNDHALALMEVRVALARGDEGTATRLLETGTFAGRDAATAEYMRGVIHQQRQRWPQALDAFVRAAELDRDNPAYFGAACQTLLQLGQARSALEFAESRKAQHGWTNTWHATLAECHEQLGDWPAAVQEWRQVLGSGDDPAMKERLALALMHSGRWGEAENLLQEILSTRESKEDAALRLAQARCRVESGQTDKARAQLAELLRRRPTPEAQRLMARVLAVCGEFAKALESAEKSLASEPRNPRSLELCAALAFRHDNTAKARQYAQRLRDAGPSAIANEILD
jgi:tetratricopeptide (TPR) repeat protein